MTKDDSKSMSESDSRGESLTSSLPWSGRGLLHHLARGAAAGLLTQVGFALLAFGNAILLARMLGASGYGAFTNAMTWVNLAVMPATLGFGVLLVRQVAVFRLEANWQALNGLLRHADRAVIIMSAIVLMALIPLAVLLFDGKDGVLMKQALWVALPLLPLLALSQLREGALRGWEVLAKARVPGMLLRPGLLLLGLLIVGGLYPEWFSPSLALAINVLAGLCALILLEYWTRSSIPLSGVSTPGLVSARQWVMVAAPMMIAGNMQLLLAQTDILMLGVITSAQETGVYSATVRLAFLLIYASVIADMVLAPVITRFHSQGRLSELQTLLTRVVRWSLLLVLLLGIVMAAMRGPLLGIFGPEFGAGELILLVLIAGRVVEVAFGSGATLLMMTGRESLVAKVFTAAALSNVLLNLLLISYFGALGAAIATATTLVISKWVFALLARRSTGIVVSVFG